MVLRINAAITAPIPSTLTPAQVWAGLKVKSSEPTKFVPEIVECKVLSTTEKGLKRHIKFAHGQEVDEEVEYLEPSLIKFTMDTGSEVVNIISQDADGEKAYLTFTFSFVAPDDLSAEQIKEAQGQREIKGRAAVLGTLSAIEKMAKDGQV